MTYLSPLPACTPHQRDRSLTKARATAREIQRKLEIMRDFNYTTLDPAYERILEDMLDEYRVEINRLINVKFVREGVVEL